MSEKACEAVERISGNMPKVSICVPTYNNRSEVERLLKSVQEQTFPDYEVVITDDSDGREIGELVEELGDGRISYTHNARKLGHIHNWNAAIAKASGEYIKIMFSDDWFTYPDSLEQYVRMLEEHPEVDLAFSNSMQVSSETSYKRKVSEEFLPRLRQDWRLLFLGNEIGAPSGTIYRNKGILFDEKSNWASDMELYFLLLEKNPSFVATDSPLVSIGLHEEQYTHSFSQQDDRIFNDYLYMYRKHELWKNELCRDFFLKEYIVKFRKRSDVAKECHITPYAYRKAKREFFWKEQLPCYIHAAGRKLGLWKRK